MANQQKEFTMEEKMQELNKFLGSSANSSEKKERNQDLDMDASVPISPKKIMKKSHKMLSTQEPYDQNSEKDPLWCLENIIDEASESQNSEIFSDSKNRQMNIQINKFLDFEEFDEIYEDQIEDGDDFNSENYEEDSDNIEFFLKEKKSLDKNQITFDRRNSESNFDKNVQLNEESIENDTILKSKEDQIENEISLDNFSAIFKILEDDELSCKIEDSFKNEKIWIEHDAEKNKIRIEKLETREEENKIHFTKKTIDLEEFSLPDHKNLKKYINSSLIDKINSWIVKKQISKI